MPRSPAGAASDWLDAAPPPAAATPEQLAAAAAEEAGQHAVPPPGVPAAAQPQFHENDEIMEWMLRQRPYLAASIINIPPGRRSLPMDVILAPGDHGVTVLHLMIDALRSEARACEARARLQQPGGAAIFGVPWDAVLRLPGIGRLANAPVQTGFAEGKTPLCYLAAQCMPGERFRVACRTICTWLLDNNATADLPACPAKCPLMLAAGSGNADVVELLLNARASVEASEGGPSLDAVLAAVWKTKGEGPNQARIIRCLESRGCRVDWQHAGQGGGTASRRSSSAAAGSLWARRPPATAAPLASAGTAPAATDSLWARYQPTTAAPLASAGAAPAPPEGPAGIAPARAPAPAVAAPVVAAPAVAAPAIPQLQAAAPAVAAHAAQAGIGADPQLPPPAAPMAAPAPAAAQPFNWQAAGGGGWGSSGWHAQDPGGEGGWGSSASHLSWRAEDRAWSSSSGARPNVDQADRVWWWSHNYEAWMYSPRHLSPGEGRWAWSTCRRFAFWFDPPRWT